MVFSMEPPLPIRMPSGSCAHQTVASTAVRPVPCPEPASSTRSIVTATLGDLFAGLHQDLLTDQFRQQHPLRLITDHLRRIQQRTLRQTPRHRRREIPAAITLQGTATPQRPIGAVSRSR